MIIIFFMLFSAASCCAMQPANSSAATEPRAVPAQSLKEYGQALAVVRSSLWPVNGLLVRYQNDKDSTRGIDYPDYLDDQHATLKRVYTLVIAECEHACRALSSSDLKKLIHHTQTAQKFYEQLNADAAHFKILVAKRLSHSKM
ncbi:hypothetical protein BH09DEP1_BH09DEP1_1580 [soil metagenome]